MDTEHSLADVVLITGGSGLIGQALATRLAPRFNVVALDLKKPRRAPPDVDFIPMDVSSDASVQAALANVRRRHGERIASVIHLAAYYSFSGEPSPDYDRITVRGTERLIGGLRDFRVEQFIFSSTMLVHAPCELGQKIDESWPLAPKWPYPRSKVDAERVIEENLGQTPYVLMRIAGVYDDRCHSIPIAHQIERIYEHHLTGHLYPGNPRKGQSFVHLEDLVDAISRAVERRASLPKRLPLLIGEPETLGYGELQEELARLIHGERRGARWKTGTIPRRAAKAGAWFQDQIPLGEEPFIKPFMVDLADDHYVLDIRRASSLLGWAPRHRLRDALPRMIRSLRSDPQGWFREHRLSEPVPIAVALRKRLPWIAAILAGVGAGAAGLVVWRRRERAGVARRAPPGRAA